MSYIIHPGDNGLILVAMEDEDTKSFTVAKCHDGVWYMNGAIKKGNTWYIQPTEIQVGYLRALDRAGMPRQRMVDQWPILPRFMIDRALDFFTNGITSE